MLALAVGLRAASVAGIEATPWGESPLVDAYTYWDQARQLVAGRDPFSSGYYQPPAYPYMLSWLFSLVDDDALRPVRIVQAILGVLTTGMILRLGARLAPWAGVIAGLVYTLYPTTLLFEQDLLTPAVTSFLLCVALTLLARPTAARSGLAGAGRAGAGRAGLAGLSMGAAASVHPTYLVACLAMLIPLRKQRAAALALAAGVGLALSPTAVSNYKNWDQLALVSHNTGINFYLGNNPDWKETAALKPGLPFRELALESDPHERDTFARNAWWRERTLDGIRADPVQWANTLAVKLWWSLNDAEIPRNEDYRCRTERPELSWMATLPVRWGLIFPLAVVGAVTLIRAGSPGLPLLWGALHLPMVLFLVADRYRLATWPVVALLAGLGAIIALGWLRRFVAGESVRRGPAIAFAAVAAIPWGPIDDRVSYQASWCLHQRANFAWNDQDYDLAADLYRASVALDPGDWSARSWLAQSLLQLDRPAEAVAALEPLLVDFPNSHPTQMLMVKALLRTGDVSRAADHAGLAYQVPGPRTNTGARYVDLLLRAGRLEEAKAVVREDEGLQRSEKVRASFEKYYGGG